MDPVNTGINVIAKKFLIKLGISSSIVGWAWLAKDITQMYPDMRNFYEQFYTPARKESLTWLEANMALKSTRKIINHYLRETTPIREDSIFSDDSAEDSILSSKSDIEKSINYSLEQIAETKYHTTHPKMYETLKGVRDEVMIWDPQTSKRNINDTYNTINDLVDESDDVLKKMREGYAVADEKFQEKATKFNMKLFGASILTVVNGILLGKKLKK